MDSLILNNSEGDHESYIEYSSPNLSGEYLLEASCPDPSLSLVGENQSSQTLSLQSAATKSSNKTVRNMNQDDAVLLHTNLNQETLTHLGSSAEKFKKNGENGGYNLQDTNVGNYRNKKAGVILLGRGNSFSLGRSEVMLLHAKTKNRTSLRRNDNCNYLTSIEDTENIENNNSNVATCNIRNLNESDNPIRNKVVLNQTEKGVLNQTPIGVMNLTAKGVVLNQIEKEGVMKMTAKGQVDKPRVLETLWQKVERVMAAKETVVQQVLEEFGIGEAGSSGDESVEKVMEETIWQAVQDNFHI